MNIKTEHNVKFFTKQDLARIPSLASSHKVLRNVQPKPMNMDEVNKFAKFTLNGPTTKG